MVKISDTGSMLNTTNTVPRFSHDCPCCAFVGPVREGSHDGDLWFCLNHKELVLRYSDDEPHYTSRALWMFGQVSNDQPVWAVVLSTFRAWQRHLAAL